MTDNVADGYNKLGFQRMWPSIPAYWGQVVQAWADNNSGVWDAFDEQVTMHGVPEAVWVMVCIFNPPGVQLEEMKQIVANVRERAPGVKIYITGQPFYEPGADCSIAGQEGPQLTDDMAKMVAEDESIGNVEYAGKFGPLSAGQKADACHANEAGKQLLGQQAADMFGE
jgi:hypothetical protein